MNQSKLTFRASLFILWERLLCLLVKYKKDHKNTSFNYLFIIKQNYDTETNIEKEMV